MIVSSDRLRYVFSDAFTHVCLHVCVYVCMYAPMHTLYIYIYIYIHTHTHTHKLPMDCRRCHTSRVSFRFQRTLQGTTDLKLRPFLAQLLPEPGRLADESHGSGRS